ncbi:CD209 antigen-like [Mugil cephalus]|uniref:CD209 antigen-like n=1 Tax=Mugil cephalus TaxID=48193 RepID=UPI001FB82F65|nr:CD209 antigen-like [Mugil cephalus]
MGVPQGSIPELLYISDPPLSCPGVSCQMYADDTVIYASANGLELSHLTLNVKKTISMCISTRNKPVNNMFEVKIKNETIAKAIIYLADVFKGRSSLLIDTSSVSWRLNISILTSRHPASSLFSIFAIIIIIIFIMKALLILSVLLSGVLVATAAAVGAAEVAPQELEGQKDNQLVENEAAVFVPEVVKNEAAGFVPEVKESVEVSAGEVASPAQVGAAEVAPQELQKDNQLVENEAEVFVPEVKESVEVSAGEEASPAQVGAAEVAPQELHEDNQLVENEAEVFVPEVVENEAEVFVPEVKESVEVSAGEEASPAQVGAAEVAPQELHEDNQLVENEAEVFVPEVKESVEVSAGEEASPAQVGAAEVAPQELHEDNQLVENEAEVFVPEVKESVEVSAKEVASPVQGRFFSCPSGWIRYKGDCYQFVASSRSWTSAVTNCASSGASLASAHDVFDYSFLQDLTRGSGYTTAWMGGFYFQGWRWLDQSTFSYSNWYSQNSATSYPCIYLRTTGGWTNAVCTATYPFICMKKTDSC